jgi:hypothetical protein
VDLERAAVRLHQLAERALVAGLRTRQEAAELGAIGFGDSHLGSHYL